MWLGMEIGEDYGMIYGAVMVLYRSYILILIVLQSKKMHPIYSSLEHLVRGGSLSWNISFVCAFSDWELE